MSLQQANPVVPPQPSDTRLRDFAQVVQLSFAALFQAAHSHPVKTALPTTNEGNPGDIYVVDISGSYWLVAKISKTQWVKFGPGLSI